MTRTIWMTTILVGLNSESPTPLHKLTAVFLSSMGLLVACTPSLQIAMFLCSGTSKANDDTNRMLNLNPDYLICVKIFAF